MYSVYSTQYTDVLCTPYQVYTCVHSVQLYIVHCTKYIVYTLPSVHFVHVYCVLCVLYSTLYSVTVYHRPSAHFVQCTRSYPDLMYGPDREAARFSRQKSPGRYLFNDTGFKMRHSRVLVPASSCIYCTQLKCKYTLNRMPLLCNGMRIIADH